jgi:hypothetical protein
MIRGCGKWINVLIKDYISSDVDAICGRIKAFITFMVEAVPQENTSGVKIHFVVIIWTKVGPAGTPKNFQKSIIRRLFEEQFKG